jgi:polysaccharide deacetylase family protein (PEP-CTERM system associated)
MKKTILLTFDVEDWFQVENFKQNIPYSTWDARELRVEKNTIELLDLLESISGSIKATFFILGWIAERCPELVLEIHKRGHEVASHGFAHHLCYKQTSEELGHDLVKSKKLLEDIIGAEVAGYRAPSFSINDTAIKIIRDSGFLYDSSYNSYEGHGRYGSLTLPDSAKPDQPIYTLSPDFFEIPVSNLRFGGKIIPWGGGGYFRLLPRIFHQVGVRRILKNKNCYTFYMHPWEIDPGQPRVHEATSFFRFRHYVNLKIAKDKFRNFLSANSEQSFSSCREFIRDYQSKDFTGEMCES